MLGRTLSHYKILSEISRGGRGIAYRALDVKLDREVALKVLPPELVADSERKRRFVQEAKAAAKLEHPHIGVAHEIDEVDGTTFIVMELIEGQKLEDIINKERLPLSEDHRQYRRTCPVAHFFVRSFYFLGKFHENRGEMDKVRKYYRRF